MADAVPSDTALTEAFKKVVGDPANPTGTTAAGGAVYATPAGARPTGDVINVSQAPGLMYTPAEQWAHEAQLANLEIAKQQAAQGILEQNRQYELSKSKFDYDKTRQQSQDLQQALALQQSMRYGGGGGGGSRGGGGYGMPLYLPTSYGKQMANTSHYLPGTEYSGAQGNVRANLPPTGGVRQLVAPPGLSGSRLGTWASQQMNQAMAEGRAPPQIVQNIRS